MDEDPFKHLIDEPDRGIRLIVKRYGTQLKSRVRRFIADDDELVKDVISEILTELWVYREKISQKKDPFMWMMVIAKNIALRRLRDEHLDRRVPMEDIGDPLFNEQADTALNYKEMQEQILLEAVNLTPKEREILIGSKLEEMDNKELSDKHGITAQRVRNLLSSGLKKIRKLLED